MKPQLSGVLQPASAVSARIVTCRAPVDSEHDLTRRPFDDEARKPIGIGSEVFPNFKLELLGKGLGRRPVCSCVDRRNATVSQELSERLCTVSLH